MNGQAKTSLGAPMTNPEPETRGGSMYRPVAELADMGSTERTDSPVIVEGWMIG